MTRPSSSIATAAAVFALASGGAAMSAAAADAMFLAELGPAHLGGAMAASSALLAVVLAVVGGLADRRDRHRVLAGLAIGSAVALAALAALAGVWPRAVAGVALVGGKQLAAATDLAFWVVIAERWDARRSRRLVPVLAAAGGAGAAAGAVLVVPVSALGARAVLAGAALLMVLAAVVAARLPATRRVAAPRLRGLVLRSWRDGARAVRRNPLARQLAIVVAAAGAFAALAYFALGVAVAARGGAAGELAALLGGVRGAGQIITLVVQLAIAPKLLARLGTGAQLLLAPAFALAAGLGLVIAPVLAVAIATQISAKVLDAGIETPAEKLAQTLLPTAVRGRIAGFLDGTAKRAGAVLGGLLAAALAGIPAGFTAVTALVAVIWLVAAARTARALPALAIAHVVDEPDPDAAIDDRAIAVLIREVGGPQPARAAEVLARVGRGRRDVVAALVTAAVRRDQPALWRALIAAITVPVPAHGPAVAAAAIGRNPTLAVRALGLLGGAAVPASGAHALVAEVAAARLAGDDVVALLTGERAPEVLDELTLELTRAAPDRAFAAARALVRALRRERGTPVQRAAGLVALAQLIVAQRAQRSAELALLGIELIELVRDRVDAAATPMAEPDQLTSLVRPPRADADPAPEIAAALQLYAALLDGAEQVDAEDVRRIARALGEPDDAVRAAAEAALTTLGPVATGELLETAAWGRRRARDRAAALLAEHPVTAETLDRLIEAELAGLARSHAAIAALTAPGDALLARRLTERLGEIAHTVLLLISVRRRSPAIARAATAWRHARGGLERARTLAVIEAALPRAFVARLVDAVDDLTPAERARRVSPPDRNAAIRAELTGGDRLARGLALHALGAAGRSAHRDAITEAAHAEARAIAPTDLLAKLSRAVDRTEGEAEMPSRVETLIALGRMPLLAALTTRQLADVAERARWSHPGAGSILVTAGDPIDALILVDDGELGLGERRIAAGEVVDELAPVAPIAAAADLVAVRASRLIRLERLDFEEMVDDVPGLAAAVCRALGERARRAEDGGYRSPLVSIAPTRPGNV